MINKDIRTTLSISLAIIGYVIAQGVGFCGFALSGAGHGSGILGYLFYSPIVGGEGFYVYLGLIIWPVIGFLLPWARNLLVTAIVLVLLGINYYGAYQDMIPEIDGAGTSYIAKVAHIFPDLVFLIIATYVLMQVFVIGSLIYLRIKQPIKSVDNT